MTYAVLFSIFKQFFLKKCKKSLTRKSINELGSSLSKTFFLYLIIYLPIYLPDYLPILQTYIANYKVWLLLSIRQITQKYSSHTLKQVMASYHFMSFIINAPIAIQIFSFLVEFYLFSKKLV